MATQLGLVIFFSFSFTSVIFPSCGFNKQINTMYLLTEWEGRTGKYLARGQFVLTESQIFSRLSRLHSVNKHFIIYLFLMLIFFWWNEDARMAAFASFRAHFQRDNDFTAFIW